MAATAGQGRTPRYGARSTTGADTGVNRWGDARYQAYALLRLAFIVAPIAFGIDKFANVMVDWPVYLAPWINDIAPVRKMVSGGLQACSTSKPRPNAILSDSQNSMSSATPYS